MKILLTIKEKRNIRRTNGTRRRKKRRKKRSIEKRKGEAIRGADLGKEMMIENVIVMKTELKKIIITVNTAMKEKIDGVMIVTKKMRIVWKIVVVVEMVDVIEEMIALMIQMKIEVLAKHTKRKSMKDVQLKRLNIKLESLSGKQKDQENLLK